MKKIIGVLLVVVILVGGGWYVSKFRPGTQVVSNQETGQAPSNSVVITMRQDDYDPSEITIKKGTTVVFVNKSSDWRWPASNLHPTHDIYPEFDPKEPVAPEKSWSFRFDRAGAWRMHDHLAPYITGTITVQE